MSYTTERRAEQHTQVRSPNYWIDEYLKDLSNSGWRYITTPQEGKISPSLVAAQDEGTELLLNHWRATQEPVEVNIVLVMPNTDIGDLPARALGYIGTTLSLASSLRERGSINISTLRILSPCYWNVYADGGDINRQISHGGRVRNLVQVYKEQYYPELDQVEVTIDTGKPITPEIEATLLPRVLSIQRDYPTIAGELLKVAAHHDQNGVTGHLLEGSIRPLAYLLAHPPAWGYSMETELFDININRRINFVPASELRYLSYMAMTRDIVWTPNPDVQIATLISGKQTRAPYYPLTLAGVNKEVTIRDLIVSGAVQIYKGLLKQYSGRIEVAETITGLNQLQSDIEQSRRKRSANLITSHPLPLHEIITQNIEADDGQKI